ncbi:hypothetical protein ACFLU5_04925 [Bacteroidota bacterium]
MKKIVKFRIVLIICTLFFLGLSAKSDYAVTQSNGLSECERVLSICKSRIYAKHDLLDKLRRNYAKNPSPGLLKAMQAQQEQVKILRIECVDEINDACQ